MSARDELETMAYTDQADTRIWALSEVRDALNTYRAEVLSGNEANPSPVVLDAQAYRWLADEISKTMVDSDRWDGDEGEEEILARYVRWLAAERTSADAEVLERAADAVADQSPGGECDCCTSAAALLRAMATAGKASSPEPTATRERTITHTWPGETPHLTVHLTFGADWTDEAVEAITDRVRLAARYCFTAVDESEPTQPADFFQPGHTYQRGRWQFQCLAVAPAPWNGEVRAVGYLLSSDDEGSVWHLNPEDWARGDWTEGGDAR